MKRVNRPSAVILFCLLLLSAATVAFAAPEYDDQYRIFFSDDPDGNVSGESEFNWRTIAKGYDVYYGTTRPSIQPGGGHTLSSYRTSQLFGVSSMTSQSRWPTYRPHDGREPENPIRRDGPVIKDAFVRILGIQGGADPTFGGRDAPLHVSSAGSVLNYVDYRVERPEGGCEVLTNRTRENRSEPERERTCVSYHVVDKQVDRTLEFGGQTFGESNDTIGGRVLEYEGVEAEGTTRMILTAEISVTINETTTRWEWDGENETWVNSTTAVTDQTTHQLEVGQSRSVSITTNQDITITQRVIQTGPDTARVVVEIEGPEDLTERRLWGRLYFPDGQYVQNTWGVYSVSRYDTGTVSTASGTRNRPFPQVPRVMLTSRSSEPVVHWSRGADPDQLNTTVVASEGRTVEASPPSLRTNVNLSTSQPVLISTIVIEGAPERISKAVDIHGDEIPIETEVVKYRKPALGLTDLGNERTALVIYDPATGKGISGATLYVEGAEQSRVVADADGRVVLERTGGPLLVRYPGQDYADVEEFYYGEAMLSRTYRYDYPLLESMRTAVERLLLAAPILVVYAIARYMVNREDIE